MATRTRRVTEALLCISLGIAGTVAVVATTPDIVSGSYTVPHITDTIHEDDPRWDCLTMGNRVCGPNWQPIDAVPYVHDRSVTCLWDSVYTGSVACDDGEVFAW